MKQNKREKKSWHFCFVSDPVLANWLKKWKEQPSKISLLLIFKSHDGKCCKLNEKQTSIFKYFDDEKRKITETNSCEILARKYTETTEKKIENNRPCWK